MILPDSGERRQFESGAVRDIAQGKGRCDLMPLGVIGEWLNDANLVHIDEYLYTGDDDSLWAVFRAFSRERWEHTSTALLEVAKHFEDGAIKYGDRNWEKGIPVHCYIDSAVRHYLKYCRGDQDEPHDRAFLWNILCAIWTHEHHPELIDIPAIAAKHTADSFKVEKMDEFIHNFCKGRTCPTCPLFEDDIECRPTDVEKLTINYNKVKEYLTNENNACASNT
jgi:hypothetical protein